jgi:glycosyltransferase involved in cell wall biosynthesis
MESWEKEMQLVQKIDQLRLEKQSVLDRLQATEALLSQTSAELRDLSIFKDGTIGKFIAKIYKNYLYHKLRLVYESPPSLQSDYDSNYNSSFKPYEVKQLLPSQPDRPRILHAIANFYTGGSSRLVVDLLEYLGDQFEQEVITSNLPNPPSYVGLNIQAFPIDVDITVILDCLQKFQPDIVHIHYWGEPYWSNTVFKAAKAYGCKIIENINTPVDPYISDAINSYVYVSDYVKSEFRTGGQSLTIYPGSDFSHFQRQHSSEPPADCIGMVYRLDQDKLNAEAIDTFIKVVQRRPQTKALIVGGGYYLQHYQDLVAAAGLTDAFTFTAMVAYADLPRFYEQMGIFVAPVWQESFGQVTPFAMSMKVPVVGYNVGALAEIISDTSLLAPPEDSDRLADIIIDLLSDRPRMLAIGQKNCDRAHQYFSVNAMITQYRALYDEILQPKAL